MIGGLLKTTSRLTVAVAAGLFMGSAAYAGGDIGGDCCADLEERVAELEATTARKGNRKVSLTIYGQVNKALVFSDEGIVNDLQIVDNTQSQSRFGFRGSAKISSDLYAGYVMEFGVTRIDTAPLVLRHNDLYIGSRTYGQVSIGHGSMATDGIAEIDLSGTSLAAGSLDRSGIFTTGVVVDNLDGVRAERLRYDTPVFAGFRLSAAWQESETYDVALRYGASLGDFTVAAGIGYEDDTVNLTETVSGSVSVRHVPTGISLTVAAGDEDFATGADFYDYWYIKGGISRKVFAAGATAFSVDYHSAENSAALVAREADKIGVQLVQSIDAAAMELYLSAWSTETNDGIGEEDVIMLGSRISF